MTTTLTKGDNAPLPTGTCRVSLTSSAGIDVSAVLLGPDGKVLAADVGIVVDDPAGLVADLYSSANFRMSTGKVEFKTR